MTLPNNNIPTTVEEGPTATTTTTRKRHPSRDNDDNDWSSRRNQWWLWGPTNHNKNKHKHNHKSQSMMVPWLGLKQVLLVSGLAVVVVVGIMIIGTTTTTTTRTRTTTATTNTVPLSSSSSSVFSFSSWSPGVVVVSNHKDPEDHENHKNPARQDETELLRRQPFQPPQLQRHLQEENDDGGNLSGDTLNRIESLNQLQPTWREEVHAVWLNGPPPRSQLATPFNWPVFGQTPTSGSIISTINTGTALGCNANTNDYTGYTLDGSAYCKASDATVNTDPYLVLYSGYIGLVLDPSLQRNPGTVIPKIGTTRRLLVDGSLDTGDRNSPPPPSVSNTTNTNTTANNGNDDTGTTNGGGIGGADAGSFLKAQRVFDHLPDGSNVRLTLELRCETHGFVELAAQLVRPNTTNTTNDNTNAGGIESDQQARIHVVRQGHAVTQVVIDQLQWVNITGHEFLFEQNPYCQQPLSLAERLSDNVTKNSDATCPASIVNCCENDYCFCTQNYISGTETNSCPFPEFPICVYESDDDAFGRCFAHTPARDPTNTPCLSDSNCNFNPNFSSCQYERCYVNVERDCTLPAPTLDITLWGDALSIVAKWNPNTLGDSCTGDARLETRFATGTGNNEGTGLSQSTAYVTGQLSLLLTPPGLYEDDDDGGDGDDTTTTNTVENPYALIDSSITSAGLIDFSVSASSGTSVLPRTVVGDFIVEVPTTLPKCNYNRNCGTALHRVDVSVRNNGSSSGGDSNSTNTPSRSALRLTLSRKFNTGNVGFGGPESARPGAEITGMTVLVLDPVTQQPLGIPVQLSKNWHSSAVSGSDNTVNAMYGERWWTANVILLFPPDSTSSSVDLTFAIVYEEYFSLPAFSHAQLSPIGMDTPGWAMHPASLGTGGDNFVVDPVGAQARSMVTHVRPRLFDGAWKEDIGGVDFLIYFDNLGQYRYAKEMTSRILAPGPCLSNATYWFRSDDNAIETQVQISGGRTNDLVRIFLHVHMQVRSNTAVSRLAFFQMGAETYNWNADFDQFVFGQGETILDNMTRTCSAGSPAGVSRAADKMYQSSMNLVRQPLGSRGGGGDDAGPLWIALAPNRDTPQYSSNNFVVGDRGLIIREFSAQYRNQPISQPAVSILCDKIELGLNAGVRNLVQGDFVDMKLEFLVLPRYEDIDVALQNQPTSKALADLAAMNNTVEWVRAQATRELVVSAFGSGVGRVESHYPIRVCVTDGWNAFSDDPLSFTVTGTALGFVPLVLCNLPTSLVPDDTRLYRKLPGEDSFTELTVTTQARQANYMDRIRQRYELVFNVEIRDDLVGDGNETSVEADDDDDDDDDNNSTNAPTLFTDDPILVTEFFFGTEEALRIFEGGAPREPRSAAVMPRLFPWYPTTILSFGLLWGGGMMLFLMIVSTMTLFSMIAL